MKITYNKNPLNTTVKLDEFEKKELWYKLKLQEYEERTSMAFLYLNENDKYFNLQKAKNWIDPNYFDAEDGTKSKLDERVDLLLEDYSSFKPD